MGGDCLTVSAPIDRTHTPGGPGNPAVGRRWYRFECSPPGLLIAVMMISRNRLRCDQSCDQHRDREHAYRAMPQCNMHCTVATGRQGDAKKRKKTYVTFRRVPHSGIEFIFNGADWSLSERCGRSSVPSSTHAKCEAMDHNM